MSIYAANRPKRQPTHPGEILREDILPALNMNVSDAAKALGVSRQMLHRVLAAESSVTPEMALRLGKFCGNGPEVWLNMQMKRDLWNAKQAIADRSMRSRRGRPEFAAPLPNLLNFHRLHLLDLPE
jgi:addiction module HigA family antidote